MVSPVINARAVGKKHPYHLGIVALGGEREEGVARLVAIVFSRKARHFINRIEARLGVPRSQRRVGIE